MREQRLEVDGRSVRCLTAGQGKPLLLCHGFLSSAEEFGGRFPGLAAHRTLIVPDLPGNGGSEPLRCRHTVDAIAASLERLLNVLGVVEFDVAGLCLGASVASALAERCGRRAGRLVLHTPLMGASLLRPRHRRQINLLTLPPVWPAVVALSRNRTVSNLYKRFVIAEGDVDADVADVNFANQRRADPWAAREWLRDGVWHPDASRLLTRGLPTLVIVPARDQVVDVDAVRRLLARAQNLSVFIDEQQGHGWNHAAVQRQLGVMLDFFGAQSTSKVG